jgi:hypothetical protein
MNRLACVFSMVVLGCGVDTNPQITVAASPGGKADGQDRSDRDCKIVLRTLSQPNGLPTHSADGVNWVVYSGRIDVADDAEGAPRALFTSRSTNGWWQVDSVPIDGAAAGYQRYQFTLDRHTVPGGDSTAWRSFRIEVVPFLATNGDRLFDHNRYPGDFDNYVINMNRTSYGDDPAICH